MPPIELKVARIGNSRGVRLPAATLARYGIGDSLLMEERSDGILLRAHGSAPARLSWEETARAMGADSEDWGAWDVAVADGLENVPWVEPARDQVAEPKRAYRAESRRRTR